MPEEKQKQNWTTYTIIAAIVIIINLVTSQSDRFFGKGEDLGVMKATVDRNTSDIQKLDTKLDKIIDILTKP